MSNASQWPVLIRQLAQRYGVDPRAALAVARVEGLSGAVGDGGHAFGPFQMNDAGGVLTGRPGNHRAYAESPQGIEAAMQMIAKVSKGLKGKSAIESIVRRFERPKDADGEVQKALGLYGEPGGGGGAGDFSQPQQPGAQPDLRAALLQKLMAQNQGFAATGQIAPAAASTPLSALLQSSLGAGTPGLTAGSTASLGGIPGLAVGKGGKIKILGDVSGVKADFLSKLEGALSASGASQLRVNSGYRSPEHNAAVGGAPHSNHMTGDAVDGMALVNGQWVPIGQLLAKTASKYGLRSGASFNWNGSPDLVHVDDFYNQGR